MGAELERFLPFRVDAGEGRDIASPGSQKLQGQVTKPADSDHRHAVGGLDAQFNEGG